MSFFPPHCFCFWNPFLYPKPLRCGDTNLASAKSGDMQRDIQTVSYFFLFFFGFSRSFGGRGRRGKSLRQLFIQRGSEVWMDWTRVREGRFSSSFSFISQYCIINIYSLPSPRSQPPIRCLRWMGGREGERKFPFLSLFPFQNYYLARTSILFNV
jgi:hypothetical protein